MTHLSLARRGTGIAKHLLASIAILSIWPSVSAAAPCTRAAQCSEWVTLGGTPRTLVYRSFPLEGRNEKIRRALIVVHGVDRQAEAYFDIGVAAARLEGAVDTTLVIAPHYASNDGPTCRDTLERDEINWPCEGNSWRSGGVARDSSLTSYDLMDEILRTVARRSTFPNLESIVVAGHSAGGQFVTRYEMANRVHDILGVPVTYVIANPSSYAYPEPDRPISVKRKIEFGRFDNAACGNYDSWPYGLADRLGYTARTTAEQLRAQLAARPATYLLGADDVYPIFGFDGSCAAMAQGSNRLVRGRAFAAYVNEHLGARHRLVVVPSCGHDALCMFTAEAGLRVLFPKTKDATAPRRLSSVRAGG
jgi:alpha/beta hydrolase family protein